MHSSPAHLNSLLLLGTLRSGLKWFLYCCTSALLGVFDFVRELVAFLHVTTAVSDSTATFGLFHVDGSQLSQHFQLCRMLTV